MKKKLLYIWVMSVIVFGTLTAQEVKVKATIDSTQIWIGQQTTLHFEISQKAGKQVLTPVFSDTIVRGLELVAPVKNDTIRGDQDLITVRQDYTLTSFEDTLLYIPPQPFLDGEDTIWSNSLSLKVIQPFTIDTTKNEIADIKNVLDPPFDWKLLLRWLIWTIIGLAILTGLYFLIRKFIKPKKAKEDIAPELKLPPYVVAISKLDKIKSSKIWQQENRSKEYHTDLTDVVREYIERTFEIPAMEMTSEEIIDHMKDLKLNQKEAWNALRQILSLADLVKFAKWKAMSEEQELSLRNAYMFVEQTKVEETPEEVKTEEHVIS